MPFFLSRGQFKTGDSDLYSVNKSYRKAVAIFLPKDYFYNIKVILFSKSNLYLITMRPPIFILLLSLIFNLHISNSEAQSNAIISGNQKRLALVIGNGKYIHSLELDNPVNDARAMRDALQNVGFEVSEFENLNSAQIMQAMDNFGARLKEYSIGLFYYAGHGIQSKGSNYLIPVDANIKAEQQIQYDCVNAERILALMEAAGSKINIVILDACRNNPFERSWSRAVEGGGLAFMNAPTGSLIAYSTSPGRTASDGSGSNGLYTSALLENIKTPDITILQMFQNVRRTVSEKSGKSQIPWESTSLTNDFYFVNSSSGVSPLSDISNYQNTTNNSNSIRTVSGPTWKHDEKSYWFYLDNQEISGRLTGSWSEKNWLVYDPVTNYTFLLEDYNNRTLNQLYLANPLGNTSEAWWRLDSNYYYLYVKGENIGPRTKRFSLDNDLLVYDEPSNTTYIFKDFTNSSDNKFRPAEIFDKADFAFWRRVENNYWLYVKGEEIQPRTKNSQVNNDLLVYDQQTNITYLLESYFIESNSRKLKPARIISYMDNILWMRTGNTYWLFIKGEIISGRTKSRWSGVDLIVSDTTANVSYVFFNYANSPENQYRPALVSTEK
jgi:hypothetical protein